MGLVDWQAVWVPTMGLLELVVRGSLVYLGILGALRLFRREGGALNTADLLMIVLVADAAQNAMSSKYSSVTEGAVLVATIVAWNYALDWLSFHSPFVRRLLQAAPLPLIIDGKLHRRNMRSELLTLSDLKEQLRKQGVEDVREVKRCYMEGDGALSIMKREKGEDDRPNTPPSAAQPGR